MRGDAAARVYYMKRRFSLLRIIILSFSNLFLPLVDLCNFFLPRLKLLESIGMEFDWDPDGLTITLCTKGTCPGADEGDVSYSVEVEFSKTPKKSTSSSASGTQEPEMEMKKVHVIKLVGESEIENDQVDQDVMNALRYVFLSFFSVLTELDSQFAAAFPAMDSGESCVKVFST